MRGQVSMELLMLFGMFALIIIVALIGVFELKREADFKAQSAAIFNNMLKLTRTMDKMRINCPSETSISLRFLKPVSLTITPTSEGGWIVVNSSDVGEIVVHYDGNVESYNGEGSVLNLNVRCDSGVIRVG